MRGFVVTGCLGLASTPVVVAQTDGGLAIQVESNQVLVSTFVFDKRAWDSELLTPDAVRCQADSAKTLKEKGISVWQTPSRCWPVAVEGLAPKDFRVLEDGIEQTVSSVARQRWHYWRVLDNYGNHLEYSVASTDKWSASDYDSLVNPYWSPPVLESYVVGYAPPPSAYGSCHHIKVSVDRRNVVVYNRTEYCNVAHSTSDPLEGTAFGQQLESELASAEKSKISVMGVSGLFFGDSGLMRVHLALEFPWDSLHRKWRNGNLLATIAALGAVYGTDGMLVARFSDQACCALDMPLIHAGNVAVSSGVEVYEIPARYESLLDLPAGQYELRVILSDGKNFGRVNLRLSVDSYEDKPLALSSVALCKRFHRVDPPEYTEGILPSKFVPLASKGVEFTPTADPTFDKKRDPLFAYFEIYAPKQVGAAAGATNAPNPTSAAGETLAPSNARAAVAGETIAPQPPAQPELPATGFTADEASAPKSQIEPKPSGAGNTTVHFQLKITNLKTGQVQINSGLRPADEFQRACKAVIPIVQEVSTHDLPKGNYRLEVQASDSAGHRTPWHPATFTIR